MKRVLFAIAILNDLTATGLLIFGVLRYGLAIFGSVAFDAVLALLWISGCVALVLALRQ